MSIFQTLFGSLLPQMQPGGSLGPNGYTPPGAAPAPQRGVGLLNALSASPPVTGYGHTAGRGTGRLLGGRVVAPKLALNTVA